MYAKEAQVHHITAGTSWVIQFFICLELQMSNVILSNQNELSHIENFFTTTTIYSSTYCIHDLSLNTPT